VHNSSDGTHCLLYAAQDAPETASQQATRNAVCLLVLPRMPPITLSRLVSAPQRAERPTVCLVTEAAAQVQATDETTRQARQRVCTVCVSATHTEIAVCVRVEVGGGDALDGLGHMTVDTCGKQFLLTFHIAFKAKRSRAEAPRSSKESCSGNMAICRV
jgi:hypothetical protein